MTNFKIDGRKFLRVYDGENWTNLSLVYTPQKTINASHEDSYIEITETTAGYTFKWTQNPNEDDENIYEIKKNQYEYEEVTNFPSLCIGDNVYVFGNLIGKIDVKITNTNMEVRSTLPAGSKVKNVNNISFFVPRIE